MEPNQNRANIRRNRIFKDRINPLDAYNDEEIIVRYRLSRELILGFSFFVTALIFWVMVFQTSSFKILFVFVRRSNIMSLFSLIPIMTIECSSPLKLSCGLFRPDMTTPADYIQCIYSPLSVGLSPEDLKSAVKVAHLLALTANKQAYTSEYQQTPRLTLLYIIV